MNSAHVDPTEQWLAAALAKAAKAQRPEVVAFWQQWEAQGGPPMQDMAAFDAAAGSPAQLHKLLAVLQLVVSPQRRRIWPAEVKALVQPLALATAERLARLTPAVRVRESDGQVHVPVTDSRTAAVVANNHFRQGLKLGKGGQGTPVSVLIGDTDPIDYGVTTGEEVVLLELMALIDFRYEVVDADSWKKRIRELGTQRHVNPALLRAQLDLLADHQEFRVRPMFGLPQDSKSPVALDERLRDIVLRDQMGVPTYFYGVQAFSPEQVRAGEELHHTLQRAVYEIFQTLDWVGESDPPSVPAVPLRRRPAVFLSYCHGNPQWHDRIATFLGGLARGQHIDLWDDTVLRTGEHWEQRILDAIAAAQVAVLVVTADFLNSAFIVETELPAIRARHAQGRGALQVLPVIAETCPWSTNDWLRSLQCLPSGTTLAALQEQSGEHCNAALNVLCDQILKCCTPQAGLGLPSASRQ